MRSLRELAQRGVVTVVFSKLRPYGGWKDDHLLHFSFQHRHGVSQSSVTSVLGDPIPTSEISVHYTHLVHTHTHIGKTFIHIQKNIYFSMCIKVEVLLKAYGVALTPLSFVGIFEV